MSNNDQEYQNLLEYYKEISKLEKSADQLTADPDHPDLPISFSRHKAAKLLREQLNRFISYYAMFYPDRQKQLKQVEQYVQSALQEATDDTV